MYAGFGSGDIDALFDLMAPDIEWIAPGNKDLMPWAGSYRGKEQVKDFFLPLPKASILRCSNLSKSSLTEMKE